MIEPWKELLSPIVSYPHLMQKLIDTRKAENADDRKVFVKAFPPNTSETQLEQHFLKYGEVAEVNLVRDKVTGQSKGYAFIEYLSKEDALKAYHV